MDDNLIIGKLFEYASSKPGIYGVLLSDGSKMAIECISKIYRDKSGIIWIDAILSLDKSYYEIGYFTSPTPKQEVTINASHIIAIWELSLEIIKQ